MRLTAEAVQAWPEARLRREYESRLDRVKAIREQAGGSLVNVAEDQAGEVRDLMAEANLLGEQLDELREEHTMRHTDGSGAAAAGAGRTATFPLGNGRARTGGREPVPTPWTGALAARYPGLAGGEILAAIGTLELPPLLTQPLVVELGRRDLLAAIPVQRIETPSFTYLRQTVRTNLAAPVATDARKPTSVITFEQVDGAVRTIAHLTERVPRSYLEDHQALRRWIEEDMAFMVREAVEDQVLNGTGTPPELEGILATSGIGVQPLGTDTVPDALHKAITVARVDAAREPTHVVMHPEDFELLALLKTQTDEYLYVQPGDEMAPRVWGLPVITTTGIAKGTALVGDFAGSAQLYEREGVRIDWSEQTFDPAFDIDGASDFETNRLRFRAEARVGLAVTRPAAFCSVTGIA